MRGLASIILLAASAAAAALEPQEFAAGIAVTAQPRWRRGG
jgi:hypothetical protein